MICFGMFWRKDLKSVLLGIYTVYQPCRETCSRGVVRLAICNFLPGYSEYLCGRHGGKTDRSLELVTSHHCSDVAEQCWNFKGVPLFYVYYVSVHNLLVYSPVTPWLHASMVAETAMLPMFMEQLPTVFRESHHIKTQMLHVWVKEIYIPKMAQFCRVNIPSGW